MAASIVIKAFLLASCFSLAIVVSSTNIALNKAASQSTTYSGKLKAANAVDGDLSTNSVTKSRKDNWLIVDLKTPVEIATKVIKVYLVGYAAGKGYYKNFKVSIRSKSGDKWETCYEADDVMSDYSPLLVRCNGAGKMARFIKISVRNRGAPLYIKEIMVEPVKCPDVDADFQGNDLKLVLDVADWKACASTCKANGACAAFSYVQKTLCCYLKTGNTNRVVKTGVISGSSKCPVTVTVAGDECEFPFKYGGQEYTSCTSINSSGNTLWCATTYDYGKDRKWGYCKLDTV